MRATSVQLPATRSRRSERRGIRWTRLRRTCQVGFAVAFVLLPVSNLLGQGLVLGSAAALRVGPLSLVDPALAASSVAAARAVSWSLIAGVLLPVTVALGLGPVFCSWVCPWGLIAEGIDRLRRGRGSGAQVLSGGPRPHLRRIVLVLLLAGSAMLSAPLVMHVAAPRVITLLPLELLLAGGVSAATAGGLIMLALIEIVAPGRIWCRGLCPVGTSLALLRTPWTLTVHWRRDACLAESDRCTRACARVCSWGIDPRRMLLRDGCTSCGACIEACKAIGPDGAPAAALRLGPGPRLPAGRP